ncbi:eukaryotic membrane protein family-domain-containing protein [Syncephalis fuscata]|nr:eukaryotic membrane protein family-domain-containing protein [Syncephalis fuscata]
MRASKRPLSSSRQRRRERYKPRHSNSTVLSPSMSLNSSNSYALLQTSTSQPESWLSSHSSTMTQTTNKEEHSRRSNVEEQAQGNSSRLHEESIAGQSKTGEFYATLKSSELSQNTIMPTSLHRRRSSLRSIANRRDSPQETVGEFSTLWDFLKAELTTSENDATAELKRERVTNFFHVPKEIEKLFTFGYFICFDSFIHVFTILPMRVLLAARHLVGSMMGRASQLKAAHKVDLIKALLVFNCCVALQLVDASRLYHGVRGQSLIKLYVIYNMLEIFDKLFCSFGQDILDSLFYKIGVDANNEKSSTSSSPSSSRTKHLHPISHFIIASIYIFIHSMILFYQLVTLNVAINSYHNSLLTMLISNQFVEIKSNVFKRFEKENLFQLTCADIVERFQLSVFLVIIAIRNVVELSVVLVFGCELLVDWLKHAFITKFNHIRPTVYQRYAEILSRDLVVGTATGTNAESSTRPNEATRRQFIDHSPVVARRMGLATLPLGCLVIRNAIQLFKMFAISEASETKSDATAIFQAMVLSSDDWKTKCLVAIVWLLLGVVVYVCMVFLKLAVGVNLFRYASAKYTQMRQREQTTSEWEHAATDSQRVDVDYRNQVKRDLNKDKHLMADTSRGSVTLENIDRFTLFKSRIP